MVRLRFCVFAVLGALVLGLGGCDGGGDPETDAGPLPDGSRPPSGDAGTGDGGTTAAFELGSLIIASTDGPGGASQLFAVDRELRSMRRISHEGADIDRADGPTEYDVAVSPDGAYVAYVSSDDDGTYTYVASVDTEGTAQRVGRGGDLPVWAPDSSRFLIQSSDGTTTTLTSVTPDGTTAALAEDVEDFVWSPTSDRVMYTTTYFESGATHAELHVVDADGANPVSFADALASTVEVQSVPSIGAWSPDGARIAAVLTVPVSTTTVEKLYVFEPDGSNATQIAGDPTTGLLGEGCCASWSPDGGRIAYRLDGAGMDERVHTVGPDGTGDVEADNPGRFAGWNADGSHLIINRFGIWLFAAPSDTLVTTELTSSGVSGDAAWSPDGLSIGYRSDDAGQRELFVAVADGTNATRVSTAGTMDVGGDWSWSEDSARLFYATDELAYASPRPVPSTLEDEGDPLHQVITAMFVRFAGAVLLQHTIRSLDGVTHGYFLAEVDGSGSFRTGRVLHGYSFDGGETWHADEGATPEDVEVRGLAMF